MAVFKCKMCGGALNIENGESVITCDYCGTKQTLPKLDDDRRANLYDRANHFRRNNEFDKASNIYEHILNEDKTDAEAYWSLVLCRYGIEYVDDPSTHKRVPTVNRAQFTSVFADENYKSAVHYADAFQKAVYEEEAKAIDEIQKGILAISQKEEPFDVFICYKETDQNGRRTQDSVLATDLYHQLTQEGFKVFFSRITLEDKLGTAYEPYIFAALNSAKVMVVFGTKPEHFNAVWVKNEWNRYLALVKQSNGKKMLIPAYKDMDPYDLPEEFSHLQAQDMSKLGFMQDLIRGIKKIVQKDDQKVNVVKESVVTSGNSSTASLLKRAFMFLEDSNWKNADEYCERVLDIEPENAEAYLGKLMAELEVCNRNDLAKCSEPFDNRNNYQKAIRFADDKLRELLTGYISAINTTLEEKRLDGIYNKAVAKSHSASTEAEYKEAASAFESILNWKNSAELSKECLEKAEVARKNDIYERAVKLLNSSDENEINRALSLFKSIPGWKDADDLVDLCPKYAETAKKNKIYNDAVALGRQDTVSFLTKAIEKLQNIPDWKDSSEKINEFSNRITSINLENEKRREAEAKQKAEEERKAEQERIAAEKFRKKIKIIVAIAAVNFSIFTVCLVLLNPVILPNIRYSSAKKIVDNFGNGAASKNELVEAAMTLGSLDIRDSKKQSLLLWNNIAVRETISTSYNHTVGLKSDGTVVAVGDNDDGQCNISDWTDVVSISAGGRHTVGLKSDGTVAAVGYNGSGQCDVSNWTDIVSISAGGSHTVGLKSDGTVIAVGYNGNDQCDVIDWTEIVAISAGGNYTVGLKSDGTVVAVGYNDDGQCDVSDWTEIVAISAGNRIDWPNILAMKGWGHTVILKSDGTVVAVGSNNDGQCDVSDWTEIVAISAGTYYTVGLKSDGTVIAVGYNDNGQCNVSDWTNIISISADSNHTVGLKSDGTVVAVGNNDYGQCDVDDWKDIKIPNAQ